MNGGKTNNYSIKDNIIKSIVDNKLLYTETPIGININFNNEYNVIIPNNFNTEHYIQIKKELNDSNGNTIECTYLYKFIENKLKFINRIKIVDIYNLKCDEDDSRIDIKLISKIDKLLNEIIINYNKSLNKDADSVKNIKNVSSVNNEKNVNTVKNVNSSTNINSVTNSDSNYTDSITNTDKIDYKYLQEQSKYKNLKKILNATLTE
jgi:hypothetical protein